MAAGPNDSINCDGCGSSHTPDAWCVGQGVNPTTSSDDD